MNQPSERPRLHEGIQLVLREGGVGVLKRLEEILPVLLESMKLHHKPFNIVAHQIQGIPASVQQYIDGPSEASDYPDIGMQMERLRLVLQYVQGAMGRSISPSSLVQSRRTPISERPGAPATRVEAAQQVRGMTFAALFTVSQEIGHPLQAEIADIDLIRRAMRATLKLMGEEKMLEVAPDMQFEKKGSYLNGHPIGLAAKALSKLLTYQGDSYVRSAFESDGLKRKWVAQRIREQIAKLG